MRSRQHSKWLQWLTALLAGIGLAVGSAACEPNEGVYESPEQEATGVEQEQQAEEDEFGVFDEEIEGGQLGEEQAGQEGLGQEGLGQEEPDQQQAVQQPQPGQEGEISLENLEPTQISDQDLAQYARLQLQLDQARQKGAIGGGPAEDQDLEEWETEMIQNADMEVDRFLAIRMMLEESPELQQRYEQVVDQLHSQPIQQQQGQPQPGQQQQQGQPQPGQQEY